MSTFMPVRDQRCCGAVKGQLTVVQSDLNRFVRRVSRQTTLTPTQQVELTRLKDVVAGAKQKVEDHTATHTVGVE